MTAESAILYCIGDRIIFPGLSKDAQYMLVDNGSDDWDDTAVGLACLSSGRLQRMSQSRAPEPPHRWVPVSDMFKITPEELDNICGGDAFVKVGSSVIPQRLARTRHALATAGSFRDSMGE